jgi:hypothetical protein
MIWSRLRQEASTVFWQARYAIWFSIKPSITLLTIVNQSGVMPLFVHFSRS